MLPLFQWVNALFQWLNPPFLSGLTELLLRYRYRQPGSQEVGQLIEETRPMLFRNFR